MSARNKWLIAALILIVVGVGVGAVAWGVFRPSLDELGTAEYETLLYEINEPVRSIDVQALAEDVVLKSSGDGSARVTIRSLKTVTHEVGVTDGTLTIRTEDDSKWYERIGIHPEGPEILLELPEADYESLKVECTSGDVRIPSEYTFQGILIHATTGDVFCEASAAGTVDVQVSTGDLTFRELEAGSVQLSGTTGSIRAESVECDGEFHAHLTTGDFILSDLNCSGLAVDGTTGELSLHRVTAAEYFRLEMSTGDIRFDDCDAETIYAKGTTGDITGTLRTGKTFLASASTGSVRVPETTGGKCELKTTTGDIRIEIR